LHSALAWLLAAKSHACIDGSNNAMVITTSQAMRTLLGYAMHFASPQQVG
jgi:hypothetical protein